VRSEIEAPDILRRPVRGTRPMPCWPRMARYTGGSPVDAAGRPKSTLPQWCNDAPNGKKPRACTLPPLLWPPGPPGPSHLAMKRAGAGQSSAHLRAPEIFTAPVTPAGATHSWRSCECDGPGLAGLGTGDWTTNYANCCRRLRAAAASCPLRLLLACRFPIPDSRFPVPDSRFPIPSSRFPIPDSPFPVRLADQRRYLLSGLQIPSR